jgi:hypothetical protein
VEPIPESREVLDEMVGEGKPQLAATLLRMGRDARRIVPELIGLSLGVLDDELTFTLEATDQEIAAIDAVQYLDGGQSPAGWWALRWSSVPYSPRSMAACSPVSLVVLSSAMDSSER